MGICVSGQTFFSKKALLRVCTIALLLGPACTLLYITPPWTNPNCPCSGGGSQVHPQCIRSACITSLLVMSCSCVATDVARLRAGCGSGRWAGLDRACISYPTHPAARWETHTRLDERLYDISRLSLGVTLDAGMFLFYLIRARLGCGSIIYPPHSYKHQLYQVLISQAVIIGFSGSMASFII